MTDFMSPTGKTLGDVLAELNLNSAHHVDIVVRRNGKDEHFEGDWLLKEAVPALIGKLASAEEHDDRNRPEWPSDEVPSVASDIYDRPGAFVVDSFLLKTRPDLMAEIMREVIVLRAEEMWTVPRRKYVGYSRLFKKVEAGNAIPWYRIKTYKYGDQVILSAEETVERADDVPLDAGVYVEEKKDVADRKSRAETGPHCFPTSTTKTF